MSLTYPERFANLLWYPTPKNLKGLWTCPGFSYTRRPCSSCVHLARDITVSLDWTVPWHRLSRERYSVGHFSPSRNFMILNFDLAPFMMHKEKKIVTISLCSWTSGNRLSLFRQNSIEFCLKPKLQRDDNLVFAHPEEKRIYFPLLPSPLESARSRPVANWWQCLITSALYICRYDCFYFVDRLCK